MAQVRLTRSEHRDDFDVEARRPPIAVILVLSALAISIAVGAVSALGALLAG